MRKGRGRWSKWENSKACILYIYFLNHPIPISGFADEFLKFTLRRLIFANSHFSTILRGLIFAKSQIILKIAKINPRKIVAMFSYAKLLMVICLRPKSCFTFGKLQPWLLINRLLINKKL